MREYGEQYCSLTEKEVSTIDCEIRVAFYTLGCKVNQYDTESLLQEFTSAGYKLVDFSEVADVYFVNSCAVTTEAARKSRQMVRRAKKRNPEANIVLLGCYPQAMASLGEDAEYDRQLISQLPVDLFCGMEQREKLLELTEHLLQSEHHKSDCIRGLWSKTDRLSGWPALGISGFSELQRPVVKVQEGCEEFCAYCLIPYARGPMRSRPVEEVVSEVSRLVQAGYSEIVLAGIHLAAYGRDDSNNSCSLSSLLRKVAHIGGDWRLRLSSVEPIDLSEELFAVMSEYERIVPHLHIPLQSGSDRILRLMGRRYSTFEFEGLVARAREYVSNLGLTTDVMVGFPGETKEDHRHSLEFVRGLGFSRIHVFPFSERPGTRAYYMSEKVDGKAKNHRRDEMLKLADESACQFHQSQVNRCEEVLLERKTAIPSDLSDYSRECDEKIEVYFGYTSNYIPAWVIDGNHQCTSGEIISVKLSGAALSGCLAAPMDD